MSKPTYIGCLECDEEIEGTVEYGPCEGDDDVVFPDTCPNCGSTSHLEGAGEDEREDFHSDI